MRKLCTVPLIAGFLAVGLLAGQSTPIRAVQAKAFVGQAISIEDVVTQVSREPQSGFTYLNFGGEFPNQIFRAVIPHSVERLLDPSILRADRVRVRGIPQLGSLGIPEIVCADPAQLTVAMAASTGPNTAGISPPPLPTGTARPATPPARSCCRICTTGKACGNSCISRSFTCRQPPGCACNS
jgi:hypothetical protein